MEIKLFEIRDHMTCMPVMCVQLCTTGRSHSNSDEKYRENKLLRRAGWSNQPDEIILWALTDNPAGFVRKWSGSRTRYTAHRHIMANWDSIKSGDLIDVRHLLGETDQPCETDL